MPQTCDMEERIRELEETISSLEEINRVLMDRVERSIDSAGNAFSLFETNILLQQRIHQHTEELERSNLKLQAEISERKRVEHELRESQARFQDIALSTSDWFWEVDADGVYTFCSEKVEIVLGYKSEEIIGKTPFDLMPPEEAERIGRLFQAIAAAKSPIVDLQNWNLHKDGHWVCLLTNGIPLLDAQGNLAGYRGADKDITERMRAEQDREKLEAQLRQAQKMEAIGTLAGGIAHDFNNILMAMLGCTDMAMYDIPRDSPAYANLEEVLKAGMRAKDLVLQILTFSRQMEQERQPVAAPPLVTETLKLLRASLPSTVEIRQRIESNCGAVMAGPTQIQQIIMNLCTNAYHAMRDRGGILEVKVGVVEVDVEFARIHPNLSQGPHVRLTVSDTGHGMDRATQERIFDPFFTTKGVGEGTGMGLATVHGIVTSLGGAVTVYSELGKGSTFQVYLPQLRSGSPLELSSVEPVPK
ncbi:MAG: PAS domain S-box protein, partial [Calditrichaeota bacterium]|nr:PAS domain S-box protein [Calditrichota bacterium]